MPLDCKLASSIDQRTGPFPRLAISDLIVLTMTVGFSLACITPALQEFLALPASELRIARWRGVLPEVIDYLSIGVLLFGLFVLARQMIRGDRRLVSPGHWIFIASGPYAVLLLLAGALRPVLSVYWFNDHPAFHVADDGLFILVVLSSFAATLWGLRTMAWRWRLVLALLLGSLLIVAVWCCFDALHLSNVVRANFFVRHLMAMDASLIIAAGGAGAAAVIVDLKSRARRDWLHYFGVATLALNAASAALHWGDVTWKWWSGLIQNVLW